MAINNQKGSELNNVRETWDQNEQNRPAGENVPAAGVTQNDELQRVIQEESAAYDQDHQGEVLPGERASVSDDKE